MFNTTHTLIGIAFARAGMDRWSRHAVWTAVIASNIPDIDIVSGFWGMPAYIEHHRGFTHSLVALPLISILVGLAMYKFSGNFWKTTGIAFLAASSHLVLDYLNTYGVRPFLPFDGRWFYGDALFIIDPIFDAVLIAALAAGHFMPARRQTLATAGLAIVTLYVGGRFEMRDLSRSYLASFQRAAVSPMIIDPFRWIGLVDNSGDISIVTVTPFHGIVSDPLTLGKAPTDDIIKHVSRSHAATAFLGFARFPVASAQPRGSGTAVTFFDARYYNGNSAMGARVLLDDSLEVVEDSLSFVQPLN